MSAKTLPREMGCWISCDGTNDKGCPTNQRRLTAVIVIGNNRSFVCKSCMAVERELHKHAEAAKEQRKKERAEARKAKLSATPRPKKPRKPKSSSSPASSPSADCAPALAT